MCVCNHKSFYRNVQYHIKSDFNNKEVRNSFHHAVFHYSPSFKLQSPTIVYRIVTRKSHSVEVLISVSRSMTLYYAPFKSYNRTYVCDHQNVLHLSTTSSFTYECTLHASFKVLLNLKIILFYSLERDYFYNSCS